MFCIYCGKEIADDSKFCPSCGEKLTPANEEICEQQSEAAQETETQVKEKLETKKNAPAPTVEAKTTKGKKKFPALLAGLVAVAVAIAAFVGLNPKQTELSELVGQPIAAWEETLDFELEKSEDGVYYLEKGNEVYFECIVDENTNVTKVALLNTEKSRYTLCGVGNGMNSKDAEPYLVNAGLTNLCDQLWAFPNGSDAMYLVNGGHWIFELSSEYLAEETLRIKAEESFSYTYPESVGSVYLGNGCILEYFHPSFAEFVYHYKETTGYNQEELISKYDRQYILVSGEVSNVSSDGVISVLCVDNDATVAAGLIWPMMGYADIELVYEQQGELSKIEKGDQVVAYGKIDMYSYNWLDSSSFQLDLGILTSVNGQDISVPEMNKYPLGITKYGEATNDHVNGPEVTLGYSAEDLIGFPITKIKEIYGDQYSVWYPEGDPLQTTLTQIEKAIAYINQLGTRLGE